MDATQLRPLAVGEVLDVAIKIYRANFATLMKAVAVVVTPVYFIQALILISAAPDVDSSAVGFDPVSGSPVDPGDVWAFIAASVIGGILGFIALVLATAACFKSVSGAYLGEQTDWRGSLRFARAKLRSIIWLSILSAVLAGVGFLLCIVPGIYLYGAFAVATPALLFEDARGTKALRRSRALVKGRWWPTAGVLALAFLLTSIVNAVLGGLAGGVLVLGDNVVVDAVVNLISNSLSSVLTTPFAAAVGAVLYFDLRVRKEGFDLDLLAGQIGSEGTVPGRAAFLPAPPVGDPGDPSAPAPSRPPIWPPPPGWSPPDA